jgi:hypothetical protein
MTKSKDLAKLGGGFIQSGIGAVQRTVESKLKDTVSVKDFGAVGDGVADDTIFIQTSINALSSGQTLYISGNHKISSSLLIADKTRCTITGPGRIFLQGASPQSFIFQLAGTINDLEIRDLTLEGDGQSGPAYGQSAIGCFSGQFVTNCRVINNVIKNINVGISLNADLSGSFDKCLVSGNSLQNILGTAPGSGYGIHLVNANNTRVTENIIDNAARHSIYQAKGLVCNNIINSNIIINHRSMVAILGFRCAISCSRSSYVTISNNRFFNCFDGSLEISHDTSANTNCQNILVYGNSFCNRGNIVPDIIIGEQLLPTVNSTSKIDILNNVFDEDVSLSLGGSSILILNGEFIRILNNRFRRFNNGLSTGQFVELGNGIYSTSDSHISNITVDGNEASCDNLAPGSKFAYVSTQLCTGSSKYSIRNNELTNIADLFVFQAPPTNLNSKFKFRVTVSYDFGSIPANSSAFTQIYVGGVKPTSMVVGRPQYSLIPGDVIYTFYASDVGPNYVAVQAGNLTTSPTNPPNQAFIIYFDDI